VFTLAAAVKWFRELSGVQRLAPVLAADVPAADVPAPEVLTTQAVTS
jgi:hypothetical protein